MASQDKKNSVDKKEALKTSMKKLRQIEAASYSLTRLLASSKNEDLYNYSREQLQAFPSADNKLSRTFIKSIPLLLGQHYRQLLKDKCRRGGQAGGALSKSKYLTNNARTFFVQSLAPHGEKILPASQRGLTSSSNFTSLLGAVWRKHHGDDRYMVTAAEALAAGITKKGSKDGKVEGTDALRRFPVADVELLVNEISDTVERDFEKLEAKKGASSVRAEHFRKIMDSLTTFRPYMPTAAEYAAGPFNPWAFAHIMGSKLQSAMLLEPAQVLTPAEVQVNSNNNKAQLETINLYYTNKSK